MYVTSLYHERYNLDVKAHSTSDIIYVGGYFLANALAGCRCEFRFSHKIMHEHNFGTSNASQYMLKKQNNACLS